MDRGKFTGTVIGLMLTTLIILSLSVAPAYAKTYRWTIGAGHPAGGPIGQIAEWFPAELDKRLSATTGDKIEWIKAFGGSIAKVGDELEATEKGILTFAPLQYTFEASKLPLGSVWFYAPFGTPDFGLASKCAYQLHQDIPFMAEALAKYNVKILGLFTMDSYQLLTTFPVRKIEDLKGKKIAGAGANLQWIKAVGAVPVQSNLTEAYTGLQTGVYEGWVMFTTGSSLFKLYEVAKYQTNCDFGSMVGAGLGMNLKVFNSLPKNFQDLIVALGKDFTLHMVDFYKDDLDASIKNMTKNGVKFYQLPFEEKKKWADLLPNFPQEFANKYDAMGIPGTQVMKYWLNALKTGGHQFPREWMVD